MTDKKIEKTEPLVKVGDEIMFSNVGMAHTAVKGIVVKAGRVWIDVVHLLDSRNPAGRFRLDTQKSSGSRGSAYDARFWTMEQHAKAMRERADRLFLRKQGIGLTKKFAIQYYATATTLADAIRLARSIGDPADLLEFIKDYGYECASGGAGYTSDNSDEILTEIKKRLGLTDAEDNS